MKHAWRFAVLCAGIVGQCFISAHAERLISIDSRPGVTQPFLLIEPESPVAAVVLFAGGDGRLELGPDGPGKATNFLVRSRHLFAAQGFVVAVPDAPSDLNRRNDGLVGHRASIEHAEDIRAIVQFLAGHVKRPVWVVGTSRGTISAANAGARLGREVAGVVLTASVTQSSRRRPATIFDVPLDRITVPVLLVHHESDACSATPQSGMADIRRRLTAASVVGTFNITGGDASRVKPCDGRTPHGFFGVEAGVVQRIAGWIRQQSHRPNGPSQSGGAAR